MAVSITRRRFVVSAGALAGLGLLAGCGRLPWQGQQPMPRVHRIGYLSTQSLELTRPRYEALLHGLEELGWIERENLAIDLRVADG
jgi:hypothetical protein